MSQPVGVPATLRDAVANRWRIARLVPRAGWGVVVAAVAVNLALGLLPVAFVVATSVMVGRVPAAVQAGANSPQWMDVVVAFVAASAAFAAAQALAPVQAALGELMARRVDGGVFDRLMAASLRTPGIGPLEDQRLLDALSEAGTELEHGFQSPGRACAGLVNLVARLVALIGYVVVVGAAFSWLVAAGVLATVVMFRYGQRGGLRRYGQIFQAVAARRRKRMYLRGLALRAPAAKEIRIFGLLSWLRDRYREASLDWLAPVWRTRRRVMLWPYLWYTAFGLVVTAVVLAAVGRAGAAGGLALTELAVVVQAVLGAMRLGEFYPESDVQTQFGMNAYEAVRTFERGVDAFDEAPAGAATAHQRRAAAPRRAIRFDGVTFAYPGRSGPVLDNLDLEIPAGRCTAIVGVNGAGKTTLVKLLTRLYEPRRGAVTVDGVDIRQFTVDDWRAGLAVIFQDFNRYETSAADNIGFGAVGSAGDREGIRRAAADAGILDALAALPDGLDTPLARHLTGGAELSGGQWQRLALARALFRLRHGAGVLVLDEPTASLDVRAEARFFDEFMRLTRGSTSLLISHRFSTVRHADRIVVLDRGRVAEQGTHGQLLAEDGRYARLFRLQADRFTEDAADDPDDADDADDAEDADDPAGAEEVST
jgi:ATP-binding cassette, subfamily B, bacterial